MRSAIAILLACLALSACGSTEKTVIVNPPPRTLGLNIKVKHRLANHREVTDKAALPFLTSDAA